MASDDSFQKKHRAYHFRRCFSRPFPATETTAMSSRLRSQAISSVSFGRGMSPVTNPCRNWQRPSEDPPFCNTHSSIRTKGRLEHCPPRPKCQARVPGRQQNYSRKTAHHDHATAFLNQHRLHQRHRIRHRFHKPTPPRASLERPRAPRNRRNTPTCISQTTTVTD